MVGTAGGPSKKKICDYITITTSEDDVGHLFVVWHVSEFGLDLSIAGNALVVRFMSGSGKFLRTRTPNLTNILDGSERERDPTFSSRSGTLGSVRVRFAFER